jgi:cytochrome c oxidase cbb3-type subunit 2
MKHEILEKNIGLMALLMVLAVSIGGLTQIVPLFFQDVTNEPVEGLKPYTALQLEGRLLTAAMIGAIVVAREDEA